MSEAPYVLEPNTPYRIDVVIEGSMLVAHVNDQIALSMRAYQVSNTGWALFAYRGTVRARDVSAHAP